MRRSISSVLRGVVTRTRNVSEYMLVLALCLVIFSYSKFYSVTTMLSELDLPNFDSVITFCVSRRRRKMYCGQARLCVCPQPYAHIIARTRM